MLQPQQLDQSMVVIAGTLGILDLAAEHGLTDMPDAIQRLLQTNFRASKKLIEFFLARDVRRRERTTGIGE